MTTKETLEFIEFVNGLIIHESLVILFLITLALYYYVREIPTFDITFLVLTQNAIDAILIPFYATFNLAHIVSYSTAALTALYVLYRTHKRSLKGETKITIVELIVLAMEVFIILCLCVRFIETSLLKSAWFSEIFEFMIYCSNYIILAVLLTPFYIKIFYKLGLEQFINIPTIEDKLLKVFYIRIPDYFNKHGE